MDSVLIQSKFPHRISLSQAAQISGYHQDYLGLLCRIGKIRASKIGRNWYTTQVDLREFMDVPQDVAERMVIQMHSPEIESNQVTTHESLLQEIKHEVDDVLAQEVDQANPDAEYNSESKIIKSLDGITPNVEVLVERAAPLLVENNVISSLEALPIKIVKKPEARQHHSLQTLINRTKLEKLRNEVLELSGVLDGVTSELAEQREILDRHERILASRKDLATTFSGGIDLGLRQSTSHDSLNTVYTPAITLQEPISIRFKLLWPVLTVFLLTLFLGVMYLSNVSQYSQHLTTITYPEPIEVQPQVAGQSVSQE